MAHDVYQRDRSGLTHLTVVRTMRRGRSVYRPVGHIGFGFRTRKSKPTKEELLEHPDLLRMMRYLPRRNGS